MQLPSVSGDLWRLAANSSSARFESPRRHYCLTEFPLNELRLVDAIFCFECCLSSHRRFSSFTSHSWFYLRSSHGEQAAFKYRVLADIPADLIPSLQLPAALRCFWRQPQPQAKKRHNMFFDISFPVVQSEQPQSVRLVASWPAADFTQRQWPAVTSFQTEFSMVWVVDPHETHDLASLSKPADVFHPLFLTSSGCLYTWLLSRLFRCPVETSEVPPPPCCWRVARKSLYCLISAWWAHQQAELFLALPLCIWNICLFQSRGHHSSSSPAGILTRNFRQHLSSGFVSVESWESLYHYSSELCPGKLHITDQDVLQLTISRHHDWSVGRSLRSSSWRSLPPLQYLCLLYPLNVPLSPFQLTFSMNVLPQYLLNSSWNRPLLLHSVKASFSKLDAEGFLSFILWNSDWFFIILLFSFCFHSLLFMLFQCVSLRFWFIYHTKLCNCCEECTNIGPVNWLRLSHRLPYRVVDMKNNNDSY